MITSKTPETTLNEFFRKGGEVTVAVEVINDGLQTIVFRNSNPFTGPAESDDILVIKKNGTYSDNLAVLTPEPPKMAEKWALHGTFFGSPFHRVFDEEYQAMELKHKMLRNSDEDDIKLDIVKVSVPVETKE